MLNKLLAQADSIAIGGHVRPDGDCVGSCMGLYQYIREIYVDKEVDVYLEDIPDVHKFIEATKDIRHEIAGKKVYDLFICLDCGDEDRLGFSLPLFQSAGRTFCVDHHVSNREFADVNYIYPDASSTSELIYNLIDKDRISKQVAEALYLGIVHDTGVFQYSCASPSTFEAAADLLRKGIDGPKIIEDTFYEKTYAQNQVLGRALLESILLLEGRCIASYITKQQMEFYGVDAKDLDGIVSQLRVTKGVETALFMYELEPNVCKVSLRSKDTVDVSRIAQYFGGGGHKKAAGFSMAGTPHDVMNNVIRQIALQL
ncbi:DHH family phosphoesterase [Extibacter muris]|uniref:DHH family phosphoesterase n=1 Tax=Extibacter muris TaxID=1796622 RepID=UPI001D06CCD2|nr:bifunctional oligoribonuclease/PAP phosphatase NrnA [Extibacter muris]MCB6200379.1 bifunctional oligoribonuclease/PAP phosphatase NrnA [Extibacter muris]MCQ4663728.1 bifunctional oligoribonuclease/PAP phosphatase NrnA [Extibacter muris]MCQ4693919.1 bifunctional oligoribonuclease/PAP phosphatase NrnA [Extibacter muris]